MSGACPAKAGKHGGSLKNADAQVLGRARLHRLRKKLV